MGLWTSIGRGKPLETRTEEGEGGYTGRLIDASVAAAAGVSGNVLATAAAEIAASAWGRAFMSAEVTPADVRTEALNPATLALIGWELVRKGEAVFEIRVSGGRVILLPSSWHNVRGGADPASWTYEVSVAGPDFVDTRTLPGDRVVHVMYGKDAVRPWRGLSPLTRGTSTANLTGTLEGRLADEVKSPVGSLIPVPENPGEEDDDDNPTGEIQTTLASLRGKLALVETVRTYADEGTQAGKMLREWEPRRIGANPPATLEVLRSSAGLSTLAACGVPVELVGSSDGTGQREAWRRFLFGTVAPVAKLVTAELAEKLDTPGLSLAFDELRASDLAGRARAFQSMVGAGMDPVKAAGIAGLMVEE